MKVNFYMILLHKIGKGLIRANISKKFYKVLKSSKKKNLKNL